MPNRPNKADLKGTAARGATARQGAVRVKIGIENGDNLRAHRTGRQHRKQTSMSLRSPWRSRSQC